VAPELAARPARAPRRPRRELVSLRLWPPDTAPAMSPSGGRRRSGRWRGCPLSPRTTLRSRGWLPARLPSAARSSATGRHANGARRRRCGRDEDRDEHRVYRQEVGCGGERHARWAARARQPVAARNASRRDRGARRQDGHGSGWYRWASCCAPQRRVAGRQAGRGRQPLTARRTAPRPPLRLPRAGCRLLGSRARSRPRPRPGSWSPPAAARRPPGARSGRRAGSACRSR
jgi:hypothetical protein